MNGWWIHSERGFDYSIISRVNDHVEEGFGAAGEADLSLSQSKDQGWVGIDKKGTTAEGDWLRGTPGTRVVYLDFACYVHVGRESRGEIS